MTLDLLSLRSAYTALNKSLGFLYSAMAKDPDLREQFRAAAIQAFAFTHKLAFKMLKRQLEQMAADLAEAFDQSELPIKVDVVDWARTSAAFQQIIELGHFPIANALK